MKKFLVILSTLIITGFFSWQLVDQSDQYMYDQTDNILIEETSKSVDKERVDRSLTELAERSSSLITKSLSVPQKGNKDGRTFVDQKYGKGDLTPSLKEASLNEQKSSSVVSTYRVMRGTLTAEELKGHFEKLGFSAKLEKKRSNWSIVSRTLGEVSFLLVLVVLLLNFIALTIINRIKDMRSAGIRLISGESISSIMFSSVKSDAILILVAFIISNGFGLLVLYLNGLIHTNLWRILVVATTAYDGVLLILSVLLSLIYLLTLKKHNLMSVIKGKLPVGRIIGIMLFCQFVSVMVVSISISGVPVYYAEWKEEQRASEKWDRFHDYRNLSTGLATGSKVLKINEEDALHWYQFQSDAINNHEAIVVKNNFQNFTATDSFEGITLNSYHPEGNVIYVTPNYLKLEGIEVDKKMLAKMNSLQLGEFGFILPEKLKEDDEVEKLFKKEFTFLTSADVKPSLIKAYVPNKTERFVYNNSAVRPQQFVKDPIIVVVTPKVTGNNLNSMRFWRRVGVDFSFYKGYNQTEKMLKQYHLFDTIASIENSQELYYKEVQFFRNRVITFLICSIIGIVTSVFLYNSMNLLYFEEFRRDIFIKRISGMKFSELHYNYMMIQLIVLVLGIGIASFFTRDIMSGIITLLIFGISMVITLARQMKKEEKYSATVLKGM